MESELLNAISDLLDKKLEPIKSKLDENTRILKALEHSAEVNKAEHDKMINDGIVNIFRVAYCPYCGNENLQFTEHRNVYCFNCGEERYVDKLGFRDSRDNEEITYVSGTNKK